MSERAPSINTFFQSEAPPFARNFHLSLNHPKLLDVPSTPIGDSSTPPERHKELVPTAGALTPPYGYETVSIGELSPGPRQVSFTGRVINILDYGIESKSPQAAKGCLKLLVKDETAKILVKLWYATTSYNILLGSLITIWTTHIHPTASAVSVLETLTAHPASILTSVFPERDNGCYIRIQEEEKTGIACNSPPGHATGRALAGLVTLDDFVRGGGEDVMDVKILVCVVALGQQVTHESKSGTSFTTLPIGIRDISTSATVTLVIPQALIASAHTFSVNITVLLITSPRLHPFKSHTVTLSSRSQIEIDPDVSECPALRKVILRDSCPINQPFPENLFDIHTIETSPVRLQFTFATLTDFITKNPDQIYVGYISLIIAELNIIHLILKKQLFSIECCNTPIYTNESSATCTHCGKSVGLFLNPNIIGEIADETGGMSCSPYHPHSTTFQTNKRNVTTSPSHQHHLNNQRQHNRLLIHPAAFTALLGRTPSVLAETCSSNLEPDILIQNMARLKLLEERLTWMRVIFMIGWTGEWGGGRLAVLRVVG